MYLTYHPKNVYDILNSIFGLEAVAVKISLLPLFSCQCSCFRVCGSKIKLSMTYVNSFAQTHKVIKMSVSSTVSPKVLNSLKLHMWKLDVVHKK